MAKLTSTNIYGTLGVDGTSSLVDTNVVGELDVTGEIRGGTSLRLTDDFTSGVALTMDRTENSSISNLFYMGVSSSLTQAFQWLGTSTTDFVIQHTGNVGIGTANPSTLLEVAGNATITGNLTVQGTTTFIDTQQLNIGDNIITLNSDEVGTPTQDAGIEVERGTLANTKLYWGEGLDDWFIDLPGDANKLIRHSGNFVAGTDYVAPTSLATVATSGSYDDLSDKLVAGTDYMAPVSLATVATSGSYDDLSDKPTIPSNYILRAADSRNIQPNLLAQNTAQVNAFFTSKGGLDTGSANSDYQDLLVMDTWTDDSGGKINALAFDKTVGSRITHYQASVNATSWDTSIGQLAYVDDVDSVQAEVDTLQTSKLDTTAKAADSSKIDGFTILPITQTAYTTLFNAGTLDANTFYMISG